MKIRGLQKTSTDGFALLVVVMVGMIMMVGGFAMLARTFGAYRGSIRTSQSNQSLEIAERGISEIINQLNSDYRYLWVNCYRRTSTTNYASGNNCTSVGEWGYDTQPTEEAHLSLPSFLTANCSSAPSNQNQQKSYAALFVKSDDVSTTSGPSGTWTLESYSFLGNQVEGGSGVLRIKGERKSSEGNVLATATIEQEVNVRSKSCGARINEDSLASNFPGLLGRSIKLGNNNVRGQTSANVFCTGCTLPTTINKSGSIIDGQIYLGPLQLPPVPIFPPSLLSSVSSGSLNAKSGEHITISPPNLTLRRFSPTYPDGSSVPSSGSTPMCVTDNQIPPIAHCLIDAINLKGNTNIIANPSTNQIRLYVNGDIDSAGNGDIINNGNSTDLAIFSTKTSCTSTTLGTQTFMFRGGSSTKAFIYAPCAKVGIKGGGGTTSNCPNSMKSPPPVDCTGGDIDGAVWTGIWDGSSSNTAEITVPDKMAEDLVAAFGSGFNVGPSDYVGVGVKDWKSFRGDQW